MIIVNDVYGRKFIEVNGTVTEHDGYFEVVDEYGNTSVFPEQCDWISRKTEDDLSDESLFCLSFLFSAVVLTALIILLILL